MTRTPIGGFYLFSPFVEQAIPIPRNLVASDPL